MGDIILVRHGQANAEATTEEDYDRLSELGHTQAAWLGEWMRVHDYAFDHVLCGTLSRQIETVRGMGFEAEQDARLNEIDFFRLSQSMYEVTGEPLPDPDGFADHMPKVLTAWSEAEISGAETYLAFETRIDSLLAEAAIPGRRVLCVTSGGVIAMFIRQLLQLDLLRLSKVMLPIWNTSIHRFHVRKNETVLAGFNAIPHLDAPDRAYARAHV